MVDCIFCLRDALLDWKVRFVFILNNGEHKWLIVNLFFISIFYFYLTVWTIAFAYFTWILWLIGNWFFTLFKWFLTLFLNWWSFFIRWMNSIIDNWLINLKIFVAFAMIGYFINCILDLNWNFWSNLFIRSNFVNDRFCFG